MIFANNSVDNFLHNMKVRTVKGKLLLFTFNSLLSGYLTSLSYPLGDRPLVAIRGRGITGPLFKSPIKRRGLREA